MSSLLKRINQTFLFYSILLLVIYLPSVEDEYLLIYLVNSLTSIIFFLFLNHQLAKNEPGYFSSKRLAFFVFVYSLFFIVVYNSISFSYRGNFFVFNEIDANFYNSQSIKMASLEFFESIRYFLDRNSYEDLGIVIIISTLYRIVESNLILNFFYIIAGSVTAICMFRISKYFMSTKFAYLCAITYSTSSFVLWYHSSGLKESLLVMLIVLFFDQFYLFYKRKRLKGLFYCFIILLSLMLFRPVIVIFCIGAIGLGVLLSWKLNFFSISILVLVFISIIYSSNYYISKIDQYTYGGSEEMIEIKEKTGMIKGSLALTYMANIISGTLGPMPTILPNKKTMLSIFSPGLLYRVILSSTFWFGMIYLIKKRETSIYPLALFFLLESVSLIYILEGLELRKSMPHFPMIYIISFWFLSQFQSKLTNTISNNRLKIKIFVTYFPIICFFLILYWNYR